MTDTLNLIRLHTRHAMAQVALRLVASLAPRFSPPQLTELQPLLDFVPQFAASLPAVEQMPAEHPLLRLRDLSTHALLADVLLLACLPELHEGFAALCRVLHPDGQSVPTVTLALNWLENEYEDPLALRDALESLLLHTPIARMALLTLDGNGPWHSRNLLPCTGLWDGLMGRAPQLPHAQWISGYHQVPGLEDWLRDSAVQQAIQALHRGLPCQILLIGGDANMRNTRVRALLGAADTSALRSGLQHSILSAYSMAFLQRACLWLDAGSDDETPAPTLPELGYQLPILLGAANEQQCPKLDLPLLRLSVQPLPPVSRRKLWQGLLPHLGEQANILAARYPIDPDEARDVVRDLELRLSIAGTPLTLHDINDCIRARTSTLTRPGVQRVTPRSDWHNLLLPETAHKQLVSAVNRVARQITVFDDWGFAQGRSERRGARMLFYGAPGTGKTLAAEVMAHALGVDMLIVDLASLVSKWLGETEKNLAAVFEIAERSRALLLFDEADALFAKRTETQDAHDRYANLETAYLLQRLERYEGVAVLTTNLRSNIDKAFTRRFEYIVEFPEPDALTREALWQLHLPDIAPLASDVNLAELAAWYAISGAQIKNATLSAAFMAATVGCAIHQCHLLQAVEQEFNKAGRAHPGFPQHTLC